MPTKTIYVRDEHLELFEKAEKLAGDNLSSAIAKALEQFVKAKEMEDEGFGEVTIEVGTTARNLEESSNIKEVRFYGKNIAYGKRFFGETGSGDDRGVTYTLYLTRKGKFLLYIEDWSRWQGESSTYKYEIYDNIEELPEGLPQEFLDQARKSLGKDTGEFLDI